MNAGKPWVVAGGPATPGLFRSFWMGGYEGADHVNTHGVPLDMTALSGHDVHLSSDHAAASALGVRCVRESIGWRLAEPQPGRFDFGRTLDVARSARQHGVQVLWTLMHYGMPSDLSLLDDRMIERFADFAAATAKALRSWHVEEPPVYTLVNEIGFLAWAAAQTHLIHLYGPDADHGVGSSEVSGYQIKHRLVRATLAAMRAVRAVDPRARFLQVEPVVHVAAPVDRPDLEAAAAQVCSYQWQVWDLLAGRLDPSAGGHPGALDLIGVNHYHSGQWEVETEERLWWHRGDRRRRRFSELLRATWERYERPLVVAETSHIGEGRTAWLDDITGEVAHACRQGLPVWGLCLYPLINRPDWVDLSHWHHSGLWDVGASRTPPGGEAPPDPLTRHLNVDYARALRRWQHHWPSLTEPREALPTLVAFSAQRWNGACQRTPQLLTPLAGDHHIVFIEEPVFEPGEPWIEHLGRGPHIDVLIPHSPLPQSGFSDKQRALLRPLLDAHLAHRGLGHDTVWLNTPLAAPWTDGWPAHQLVYDCPRDADSGPDALPAWRAHEAALMAQADWVLTAGPSLHTELTPQHPRVRCIPNAADLTRFAPAHLVADSEEARQAAALQAGWVGWRLGYFGAIDERIDLALVSELATTQPDWQLVMVGPVTRIDPSTLPQHPNLHWLGEQPHALMPYLVASWQLGLLPFVVNAATRCLNPTQTLEYLAATKPVVSTALPDVLALHVEGVEVAADGVAFVRACQGRLAESPAERTERPVGRLRPTHWPSWCDAARAVQTLLEEGKGWRAGDTAGRGADGSQPFGAC
ncbi:MAG: hypothetical protein V4739_04280 [Pseudomonadota bacterium]